VLRRVTYVAYSQRVVRGTYTSNLGIFSKLNYVLCLDGFQCSTPT